MNKRFFDPDNIPTSDIPSNYVPKDAELYTSVDYGTKYDDSTAVANFIQIDGVIHLQSMKIYNSKGKLK